MLVDGQCIRRWIFGRRHVPVISAERPWLTHGLCGVADHAAEPDVLSLCDPMGLVRGPLWPANNADDHVVDDDSDRAALPADGRLLHDRGVLHTAGILRRRRYAHAVAALSVRTVSDRGTSHRHGFLLPPGRDLRRPRGAGCVIL